MRNLLFSFFVLLIVSCAQVVVPDGGPKDIEPPVVLSSSPGNFTTGFSGNSIRLDFDEYVQLKNEQTQVIISPGLGNVKYRIRGKSLFIDFDTIPKANTTYILNFGDAIVDFNESNPLDSNLFVFSTGSYIDSLEVRGKIESAGDSKVEKGVLVMLYSELSDSVPFKSLPEYVTRTDASGYYNLEYLKPGTYKMIALLDANNNFRFDDPDKEKIGFLNDPLVLNRDTSINLQIFVETPPNQRLRSASQVRNKLVQFVFGLPVSDLQFEITPPELAEDTFTFIHPGRDTVSVFMPEIEPVDTFQFIYSVAGMEPDTERITPVLSIGRSARRGAGERLEISLQREQNGKVPFSDSLMFNANTPVRSVDTTKIFLVKHDDTLGYNLPFRKYSRQIVIHSQLEPDSTYRFTALPGAFTDATGRTNDTILQVIEINNPEYFGNLSVTPELKDTAGQYILLLQTAAGVTVGQKTFEQTQKLTFNRLAPGSYTLKIVVDANNNGKWDTGSYREKRQPEKVFIYSGGVTVRSNWDQDLQWEVNGSKKGRIGL